MDVPEKNLHLGCRLGQWDLVNPFILGAGGATRNVSRIHRAFSAGWAGAVTPPVNMSSSHGSARYAGVMAGGKRVGLWRRRVAYEGDYESWKRNIQELKRCWPDRILWGSIYCLENVDHEHDCQAFRDAAADAVALDMSSYQCVSRLKELVSQLRRYTDKPWMLCIPHDTDYFNEFIAEAEALGAQAIMLRGMFTGCAGVDLANLTFQPCENGVDAFDGEVSGVFLKPAVARGVVRIKRRSNLPIIASGVVATWSDAAELLAAGSGIIECSPLAILYGFNKIDELRKGLISYLTKRDFDSVSDLIAGAYHSALPSPAAKKPRIEDNCTGCGRCIVACADGGAEAIRRHHYRAEINPANCVGCGLCKIVCPGGHIK